MISKKSNLLKSTLLASLALAWPGVAAAQEDGNSSGADTGTTSARPAAPVQDTEIVVTALRRASNIQETPLAISAVGATTLQNQGITSSADLARVAPNLVLRDNGFGGSRVIIRNIQAAGEPTVGLYYDETPITGSTGVSNDAGGSTPAIRLFDVERVEVLRGPQGTLYGAGSMAGTIRLIFNKPKLDEFEGEFFQQISSASHGDMGYTTQGALNVPLIDGLLGVRAVGFYDLAPGWLDNSQLGLKNFNNTRSYGGRLMVRVQPASNLTFDALGVYQRQDGYYGNWNYQTYNEGGVAYDQDLDTRTPNHDEMKLISGTLEWEMDWATLTANAAYTKRDYLRMFNYSAYFSRAAVTSPTASGCLRYFGISTSCSDAQVAEYSDYVDTMLPAATYQPESTESSTQEVRLTGSLSIFDWTAGFYHSKRDNFVRSVIITADEVTGIIPARESDRNITFDRNVADMLEQTAGFGEVTANLAEGLSVTGGIRYFEYEKVTTSEVTVGNIVVGNSPSDPTTNSTKQNGTVLNFNANWEVTPDAMIYASASQGFRPGGVNQIVGISDDLAAYATDYESDSLWNYELGIKTAWLNRSVIFNANVFQIDWDNMQVSASANNGSFGFVTNAGKVRVRGIELETTVLPTAGLTLRASGSYTSAQLQGDQVGPEGITIRGSGSDGDYVPYTPKWTGQASADYLIPLNANIDLLTHANVSYTGSSWTQFDRDADPYFYRLPAITLVGLRFGIQAVDMDWSVSLFATNLFDTVGIIGKSNGASVGGDNSQRVNVVSTTPRTIGLNFRKKF